MKLKIGLKYCGGCNPEYDRVELVTRMEQRLREKATFVSPDSQNVDIILAVQGCSTACADLSPFDGLEVLTITCEEDARVLSDEILKKIS